jgi:hypothetical protein
MSHLDSGVLHELLDGEIPSSELAPIQAHLHACAECRGRLEAQRRILFEADELIEALEVPDPAQAPSVQQTVRRRSTGWMQYAAWAATVVIAAGLGYSTRPNRPPIVMHDTVTVTPPETTTNRAVLQAPRGRSTPTLGASDQRIAAKTNAPAATRSEAMNDGGAANRPSRREATAPPASVAQGRVAGAPATALAPQPTVPSAQKSAAEMTSNTANQGLNRVAGRSVGGVGGGRGMDNLASRDAAAFRAASLPIDTISFPDAVQRLGGSLRLIDGLVPMRLEAQGAFVRVVYPTARGELLLQQQLIDGRIVYQLIAPRGFPDDSLGRLRGRVRE